MKKTILLLLLFITANSYAQVKNGDAITKLNFSPILNAPVKQANLAGLKGKVVLIEFWATWCGSCLEAMPHLKALQKKYGNKLQVITVTDETPKRTAQYLTAKPSNLWFAVDTGRAIATLFPHQLIPHTVLISPEGTLLANTLPEAVTPLVIDSILHRKKVHLPKKKDVLVDGESILKTVFFAADTVKSKLNIQEAIKGAPGMSTLYPGNPVFSGRRFTGLNLPLVTLYMIAYGNFPYKRMINQTGSDPDKEPAYCIDLIVENKQDLLPTLQSELLKRFDLQAKVIPQVKEVYVLTVTDPDKFSKISINTSGQRTYTSGHGYIDQQSINMNDFADYIESYGAGLGRLLVVDETHDTKKYDIKFSFRPETPSTFTTVLSDMGLNLQKAKRKVDMLLVYK